MNFSQANCETIHVLQVCVLCEKSVAHAGTRRHTLG